MKRGRFPQRIKRGSCVVTIYKTPSNGYDLFTVAHYDAGGKFCRRTFADLDQARSAAEKTAESLAGGTSDTHVLTGEELLIYRRATEALKSIGVPLDLAVMEFTRSMTRGQRTDADGAPGAVEPTSRPGAVKAGGVEPRRGCSRSDWRIASKLRFGAAATDMLPSPSHQTSAR
ncbi:MAG: hypothetical protein FJ387_26475 [Verrucomicrobia bacterium]|nr:hypothetical protein [Verrucomicrobiota bacterium]